MSPQSFSKLQEWSGHVASGISVLWLTLNAMLKLSHNPHTVTYLIEKLGYSEGSVGPIGFVELACMLLYAVPRTSVLGALLLTGYLGGAVATHVRVGDTFGAPLVLGVFVWAGLFLRDERFRALLSSGELEAAH